VTVTHVHVHHVFTSEEIFLCAMSTNRADLQKGRQVTLSSNRKGKLRVKKTTRLSNLPVAVTTAPSPPSPPSTSLQPGVNLQASVSIATGVSSITRRDRDTSSPPLGSDFPSSDVDGDDLFVWDLDDRDSNRFRPTRAGGITHNEGADDGDMSGQQPPRTNKRYRVSFIVSCSSHD
jgi:hypothetical protein